MNDRYKKSVQTRLKNNPDAYKEMGRVGGKKGSKWLKGNSEYMSELVKKRWAKVKEEKERENTKQPS